MLSVIVTNSTAILHKLNICLAMAFIKYFKLFFMGSRLSHNEDKYQHCNSLVNIISVCCIASVTQYFVVCCLEEQKYAIILFSSFLLLHFSDAVSLSFYPFLSFSLLSLCCSCHSHAVSLFLMLFAFSFVS